MPQDKSQTVRSNPSKPLKPTLASTRAVRSPITPRLANSSTTSLTSDTSGKSKVNGITRAHAFSSDSLSTPTSSLLINNVTPRSTLRKSRVDSAGSTPTGSLSPAPHIVEGGRRSGGTLSPAPIAQPKRPASVLGAGQSSRSPLLRAQTFAAPVITRKSPTIGAGFDHADSKFFHAYVQRSPERERVVKKPAVFFHANGDAEAGARQTVASPSPPLSAVSARSGKSQFVHANGLAEDSEIPPVPSMPNVLKAKVPQLSPPANTRQPPMFFQPLSPGSGNIHLSYRKGASQIIRPGQLSPKSPSGPLSAVTSPTIISSAFAGPLNRAHRRASSLSSIDSTSTGKESHRDLRKANMTVSTVSPPRAPAHIEDSTMAINRSRAQPDCYFGLGFDTTTSQSHASETTPPTNSLEMHTAAPERTTHERATYERTMSTESIPQSPIKANLGPSDLELANNARRERKVMDLEISNSSLLAINRQLEKEVRRQKAELRRFRRLSRVGRLSSLSEELYSENREIDGEGSASMVNPDLLEALEEEDEMSDPDDASSVSSEDEGNMTPATLAAHDAKRIARDSKRLQIDLAKHRELLVDSQKMNQSLRRCMAWTEEMLREGKKQLDHRIRVSDVKLGGRILDPVDDLNPVDEFDENVDNDKFYTESTSADDSEAQLGAEHSGDDDMHQLIAHIEAMSGAGGRVSPEKDIAALASLTNHFAEADSLSANRG